MWAIATENALPKKAPAKCMEGAWAERDFVEGSGLKARELLKWVARRLGVGKCVSALGQRRFRAVSVNGRSVAVPDIWGLLCASSEPWMVGLLSLLLGRHAGGFLDVGANLGQTLIKLRALDPHRPYVGLEPNPACVFYLQQLITKNGFGNCTIVPVGLSAQSAIRELCFYEANAADSMASLIPDFRPDRRVQSRAYVPVFAFEEVEKAIGSGEIGIVKIDVEGSELEVLKTLLPLLHRDRPFVSIEVLPVYSAERVDRARRQEEAQRLLKSAGYRLYRVEKSPEGALAGLRWISEIGIHSDLDKCDYLAAPEETSVPLAGVS